MSKILAYGLWMLLNLSTANALWCYQCSKPIPTGKCPEIQELCWAGAGSGCYTNNLYLGSSMISSEVGCMQDCYDNKADHPFIWHEHFCCFTDYCNE